MTEADWLACDDPAVLLVEAPIRVPERRLRLFSCACCRAIWPLLTDDRVRACVTVGEAFADGTASEGRRARAVTAAGQVAPSRAVMAAAECAQKVLAKVPAAVGVHAALAGAGPPTVARPDPVAAARAVQAVLLRDILGNPFRPVAVDPAWHTSDVLAMCRGMYEARDFAAMPILADALQDAGCEDTAVLDHCRVPGPHVRGCWVVDLVRGKE